MSRRKIKVGSALIIISSLFIYVMTTDCAKEYPAFNEYQVAGYAPIDTLLYGGLFLAGDRLYVLYDISHYNQWNLIREYDISDPITPELISAEEMTLPLWTYYISHQDTFVFFQSYYADLIIFNLHSRVSHFLDFDVGISDIAQAGNYLFISALDGFRVLDISGLPNYVEVFYDSSNHYSPLNVLRDTVLLEIYQDYGYRFKFWNVTNPTQPQAILDVEMPNQPNYIGYVGLTGQYIVCSEYASIYIYRYELDDSLVYEDRVYLDFTPNMIAVSDSLIYVADQEHIEIIQINDPARHSVSFGDPYSEGIVSMDIRDELIYVLIRNLGVQIYERRQP